MIEKNNLHKFLLIISLPLIFIFTQCFTELDIKNESGRNRGNNSVCKIQGAECGVVRGDNGSNIDCGSASGAKTCIANRLENTCSLEKLDQGKFSDLFAYVPIQFTDSDLSNKKHSVKTTLLPKVDVEAMFPRVSRTDFRQKKIAINFGSKTLSLPMTISFKFIPRESNQRRTIMESSSFKINQTTNGKIEFVSLKDNKTIAGNFGSNLKTRTCNHFAIVLSSNSISMSLNGKQDQVSNNLSFNGISKNLTIGPYEGKVWDLRLFDTNASKNEIIKIGAPCDDNGGLNSPFSGSPDYLCGVYVCGWWPKNILDQDVTMENLKYGVAIRDMTWEHNFLSAGMYEHGKLCQYLDRKRHSEFRDEGVLRKWIRKYTFEKPWGGYALHEGFHTYQSILKGTQYFKGSKYFREATANWGTYSYKPGYDQSGPLLGAYTLHPHYALYADQKFPGIPGVSTMFSGGHQYGAGIFYAYLTEFAVDPWIIGKLNNYPVKKSTEAVYKLLKEVGVDMREEFADFAVMITTWDWPIHGPLYAKLEDASYKRLHSKWESKQMPEPEEEVNSKITATYGTNGTGSNWKKVPKRFKVGSWAFNAYEVNVDSENKYSVKFKPDSSNPSYTEFRLRVVVYNESTGKRTYYKVKSGSGSTKSTTVDAKDGEKIFLVVVSTPSTIFEGLDTYDYEFMINISNGNDDDDDDDDDDDNDGGDKYKLRVKKGSGSGSYSANEVVKITAKKSSNFKKWKVVKGNPKIKQIKSSTTTLTMPSEKVVIKAIYSTKSRQGDVGCGDIFNQQVDEDEEEEEEEIDDENV